MLDFCTLGHRRGRRDRDGARIVGDVGGFPGTDHRSADLRVRRSSVMPTQPARFAAGFRP